MAFDKSSWVGERPLKALALCAVIAAVVILALLPISDELGGQQIDEAFARALVGFAIARGLNGVISVAQGTEVAIQPAGVGLNFAPGEILDPINDLVERFSWIMMLASSSLGVQKVLLSMSAWQGLAIAVAVLGCLLIVVRLLTLGRVSAPWLAVLLEPWARQALTRLFLFVLILRFMMPAVIMANNWVYETFLQQDYVEATRSLEAARDAIANINDEVRTDSKVEEADSLIDRALDVYRRAVASVDLEQRLDEYRAAAESVTENTIRLVVVFLMQTLVFPLLFLYIVYGLIRRLTRWQS